MHDELFSNINFHDWQGGRLAEVKKAVNALPKNRFLADSDEEIIQAIYTSLAVATLSIDRENYFRSDLHEKTISRNYGPDYSPTFSGVTFDIYIPFSGNAELWAVRPSPHTMAFPRGDYSSKPGYLTYSLELTQGEYNNVNKIIENYFQSIELYLENLRQNISEYSTKLLNKIRECVTQRRQEVGAIQELENCLNIPLERQANAPNPTPIPLQKIELPRNVSGNKKEYTISQEDYKHILRIIRHEGASFERTPYTFSRFEEEDLRNILLAHLNGHYTNMATGETFRKNGKTDIYIPFENNAGFVAECKFWTGEQNVISTVDQLLGYLTWRDCKAALIFFNKRVRGFSQIQEKLQSVFRKHPQFASEEHIGESGEWRMIFHPVEDPGRKVTVHVFLFDLYVEKPSTSTRIALSDKS